LYQFDTRWAKGEIMRTAININVEGQTEQRSALLASIAAGSDIPATHSFPHPLIGGEQRSAEKPVDPFDTVEYRTAFMEYACRGKLIPMELRAAGTTGIADAGAAVPTTLLNEIVKKLQSYGGLYNKVRKLNIQGGVEVPILTLKPTATWSGEAASPAQKVEAKDKVSFNFYGLECKIAQTLLVSVITYDAFQREFVPLAVEAIIRALEIGIIKGTGDGQMLGVTIDTRVPAANKITLVSTDFTWKGLKTKVFSKIKKSYRKGVFVMAQGTFDGYIDGMVDAVGQPIGRVNYGIDGEEKYRFAGKEVLTVEDDVIANFDDAAEGEVVAVFLNPEDYAINSNMQMTIVEWTDHDTNKKFTKAIIICDGKLLDAHGVIVIKKGEVK
jgi:HK97 family phage major capsid protein